MNYGVTSSAAASTGIIAILVWLVLGFAFYMLPSIIALAKRNRRTKVILFNIFLGWTIVMWIICLVWACKREAVEAVPAPQAEIPAAPIETTYTQQ